MSLARGAARGTVWNFATVLFERGFGFIILGILLRYIPASSVGVVAIGSAISDLVRMLSVGGAGEQVQAAPGDKQIEAGAFWSQFLASVVFVVFLLVSAPAFGRLYGQPVLALVLRFLALNVLLTSFLVVPAARLASNFKFRSLGLIAFGSTVTGGLVALPFAFAGRGVDALIYQRVVAVMFYVACVCSTARWLPPRPPSWAVLRRSLQFSLPLMQTSLVDYVSYSAYVMVVGLHVSVADVGRFRIAQRLVEVIQEIAFAPARNVFLPVFVAVRDDPARRFDAAMLMIDAVAMVIFFAAAVAGASAKQVVLLMFGQGWAAAVPVFAIMSLMVPVSSLYSLINPVLTAADKVHMVSLLSLINVATVVLVAWFASSYGLIALAWALTLRGLLSIALFIPAMKIGLGRPVLPLIRLLLLPACALAVARLAAWLVLEDLPQLDLLAQLAVSVAVSGLTFCAVLLIFARHRVQRLMVRVRMALGQMRQS
ncbi:MAG: oligosaccharide flippase family protein [Acidocella sp.]|nr:oligosaccharide flippase family protein [Acidocella sp.]